MNLNRRDFLKSLMAVSAVAILPVSPAVETMPEWVVAPDVAVEESSDFGTWISLDGKRYLLDYAQVTEGIPYDSLDNTYSDARISWSMGWDRQRLIEIKGNTRNNSILDMFCSSGGFPTKRTVDFEIGTQSWPYIFQGKAVTTSINTYMTTGLLQITDFTLVCYGPLAQVQVRK